MIESQDLAGLPVLVKVGAACGTGLVVKGIKADGGLECAGAAWGDLAGIPLGFADGIDNTVTAQDLAAILKSNAFDLGAGSTVGGSAVPKLIVVGPKDIPAGEVYDQQVGVAAGLVATAWVATTGGEWALIGGDAAPYCSECGTGRDGPLVLYDEKSMVKGGEFHASSVYVGMNVDNLRVLGAEPLIIKSTGPVIIAGKLNLSGENGTAYDYVLCQKGIQVKASQSGAGGFAGGAFPCGCPGSSPSNCASKGQGAGPGGGKPGMVSMEGGGGGGHATKGANGPGPNGQGGVAYGDQELSQLLGGSGGGAGAGNGAQSFQSGTTGGAGGGALKIVAPEIRVTGGIFANGGAGIAGYNQSNCPGCSMGGSGGGSGGAIWLRARKLEITGAVTALGGLGGAGYYGYAAAQGAYGRVRFDFLNGTVASDPPHFKGDTGPNSTAGGLTMHQAKAGTIRIRNQSGETQKVVLAYFQP